MTFYLLAQVFSAIGALCVAISSFAKSKNNMLVWQITDYIFTAIANLLLGGYTGALTISISIIRNSLMVKKEDDQDYLDHPHHYSNHRRNLSQSTWDYWLFTYHLFSFL